MQNNGQKPKEEGTRRINKNIFLKYNKVQMKLEEVKKLNLKIEIGRQEKQRKYQR